MKNILLIGLFVISACAGKLGPDADAQAKADLLRLNVATAVDHAVDGIILANAQEWLNDKDTLIVLKALHVSLESVRTSASPVETIVDAVQDVKKQVTGSNLEKWNSYLDSLTAVVLALK